MKPTFALGLRAERGADAFPVIPLAMDGTGLHPCEQPANPGVREGASACWRLEAPRGR